MKFTQILDILQAVLRLNDIKFLILTGSTPVDIRQTLVDEFTEDESISVFLLSTKAGGNVKFDCFIVLVPTIFCHRHGDQPDCCLCRHYVHYCPPFRHLVNLHPFLQV